MEDFNSEDTLAVSAPRRSKTAHHPQFERSQRHQQIPPYELGALFSVTLFLVLDVCFQAYHPDKNVDQSEEWKDVTVLIFHALNNANDARVHAPGGRGAGGR